ncbi:putative UDP-sugar transporter protein SLC35A4 [Collichthys lucidus]|uniref:Putative UDP-sugar transporter protein SLC35A4 n=1 Tax=Collichthys lucidus TaxID=240159 RepID=A0A4U5UD65_COLLU|nr:putative UDP-sugar transporter protein SLC35A4 [Collichthys lucidus]
MIVIPNVGPSSPARIRRQWLKRIQWGVLFGLMVLIYGSHAPLITLTKVDGQVPFNPSSCVLMIELAKLLISLATLILTGGTAALSAPPSLFLVAPYAVPAILYALNNNLVVLMQAYMDPSSYQVLSNLKIASTALLVLLLPGQEAPACTVVGSGAPHVCRGLAAVYTERVLKSQRLPLSLQNLYLYVFGVAINGFSSFAAVGSEKSFLEGYSGVVWAIIAGQAANGLFMSVVLKHGSGITRLFVISCSMLVNALLSWVILGAAAHTSFPPSCFYDRVGSLPLLQITKSPHSPKRALLKPLCSGF